MYGKNVIQKHISSDANTYAIKHLVQGASTKQTIKCFSSHRAVVFAQSIEVRC